MKTLLIDAAKCSGCRACETYCALKHDGECNPALGRIHVVKWEQEAVFVPINCMRCRNAACESVCPKGATRRNFLTGALQVDASRCIGCLSCLFACPFGATFAAPQDGRVLKCDLCDGDPTCAKVCPTSAIVCEDLSRDAYLKLIQNAERIPLLVKQALGRET